MAEEYPNQDPLKMEEDEDMNESSVKSSTETESERKAQTLLTSAATSSGVASSLPTPSESDLPKSPLETHEQESVSPTKPSVPSPVASPAAAVLSPGKEKGGFLKGVKTAITDTAKSVWKKISPKKSDKLALAANPEQPADPSKLPGEASGIVSRTYMEVREPRSRKNRGSVVVNSVASDETTLVTSLGMSSSEVFEADDERRESVASCDTGMHISRLPSLTESVSMKESEEGSSKPVPGGKRPNEPDEEPGSDVHASPLKRVEHE